MNNKKTFIGKKLGQANHIYANDSLESLLFLKQKREDVKSEF